MAEEIGTWKGVLDWTTKILKRTIDSLQENGVQGMWMSSD
jgi:hypothetical protein